MKFYPSFHWLCWLKGHSGIFSWQKYLFLIRDISCRKDCISSHKFLTEQKKELPQLNSPFGKCGICRFEDGNRPDLIREKSWALPSLESISCPNVHLSKSRETIRGSQSRCCLSVDDTSDGALSAFTQKRACINEPGLLCSFPLKELFLRANLYILMWQENIPKQLLLICVSIHRTSKLIETHSSTFQFLIQFLAKSGSSRRA